MRDWRYSSAILNLDIKRIPPRLLYPRGKNPLWPLDRRLGGLQSRFGRCAVGKCFSISPELSRLPLLVWNDMASGKRICLQLRHSGCLHNLVADWQCASGSCHTSREVQTEWLTSSGMTPYHVRNCYILYNSFLYNMATAHSMSLQVSSLPPSSHLPTWVGLISYKENKMLNSVQIVFPGSVTTQH
jgi:hypothetical protein